MLRNPSFFPLIFFGFVFSSTTLLAEVASQPGVDELYAVFEKFRSSYDTVQDYSARFHKEERSESGKWQKEVLDFRFKKPFGVRIKWVHGPKKGREVVFVEGKNNNKIIVKMGGLISILIPKISLDPNSNLAKDEAGHTIREAGIGYLMEEILKVTEKAYAKGDLTLKLLEKKNSSGSGNILKIERRLPHGKGYATDRLVIYVDEDLGIPVGVERYDSNDKLFGKYYYQELKTNLGLKDEEFKL